MQWVIDNKEWIFGGIGMILSIYITIKAYYKKRILHKSDVACKSPFRIEGDVSKPNRWQDDLEISDTIPPPSSKPVKRDGENNDDEPNFPL